MILYTLTMLTITQADRSRPTLKDDERFRNRLVCDLTMKAKLSLNMFTMVTITHADLSRSTLKDEERLNLLVCDPFVGLGT